MKRKAVRMLALSAMVAALSTAAHAEGSSTLTAKEKQYAATITVTDVREPTEGKKSIAYRIVLSSKTCNSVIAGTATFFSNTDDGGDDSAFLPNGYATKINSFKDSSRNGIVELVVDVESKQPRYVDFTLAGASVAPGSCVPKQGVGFQFYSAEAYKPQAQQ